MGDSIFAIFDNKFRLFFMTNIPFLLIYSRIIIGFVILVLAFVTIPHKSETVVALMVIGLLTDVFDGIIARKLNVASEKLRVWDSNVDQFFWLSVLFTVFYSNQDFLFANWFWIALIVLLEASCYIISYIKFKKPIATHSYMAKLWTLSLLAFLIDLSLNANSTYVFWICIFLGILSRAEIILIILRLKHWATDVSSIGSVKSINDKYNR